MEPDSMQSCGQSVPSTVITSNQPFLSERTPQSYRVTLYKQEYAELQLLQDVIIIFVNRIWFRVDSVAVHCCEVV